MTRPTLQHFALNVYQWTSNAQDQLLAECLGPAARSLGVDGLVRQFWFYRFDVRGPHLGVLFGASADGAAEACAVLKVRLDAYLATFPCTVVPAAGELEKRHAECRGAVLCAMDAEPGLAPNNSYCLAPHPADGFFLRQTSLVPEQDELWLLLGELAFWSISRLGPDAPRPAVRWFAAMDGALRRATLPAEACWRYYATTLRLGMKDQLRVDENAVVDALPRMLGERNLTVLSRAWAQVEDAPQWASVDELVRRVMADDGRALDERVRLLRTLNHSVLSQLGQPASLRIPVVLYAWLRNLRPASAC
jgi:hypothetical protein